MSETVIYLHGFLSSPQSVKATQTQAYVRTNLPDVELIIPELPNYPEQAIALVDELAQKQSHPLKLIGSSMGGYFCTYLLEKYAGRAVLINPAVHPDELLQDYLGEHINPYTQKRFVLQSKHADSLTDIKTQALKDPSAYKVLLQTGDETLDYRLAETKYAGADMLIEVGGDHSFQHYDQHLPAVFEFLLSH